MARPKSITKRTPYTPTRGPFAGQTFLTQRGYDNARAQLRGFGAATGARRGARPIRTEAAYRALRPTAREGYERALRAKNHMVREGLSLSQAARLEHTTPETVRKWVGVALTRDAQGRIRAKSTDRLLRPMAFLTVRGEIVLYVTSSRTASTIGRYMNALKIYAETRHTEALRLFRGKSIRVGKVTYPLLTDPRTLDRLLRAGELPIEVYASVA